MHYAAANGKKDAVKYLLEQGADATIVNVKEQKAIDYSNIKGYNEITALLLQYGPASTIAPQSVPAIKETPPANSTPDKKQALLDLKDLLDAGILTQDEFDAEKKKILG